MSFLDKLKKSVNDASTMAKVTVEVNRLKIQIASHKKQIAEYEAQIGKLMYEAYTNSGLSHENQIVHLCKQIEEKHEEVAVITSKINELNGEKQCECGQTLPKANRFCPTCGHKFTEIEQSKNQLEQSSDQLSESVGKLTAKPTTESVELTESYKLATESTVELVTESAVDLTEHSESESQSKSITKPDDESISSLSAHIVCEACSEVLEPGSRFCNNCGTAVK